MHTSLHVLDLRPEAEVVIDATRPDFSWLGAWALAAVILVVLGFAYLKYLDHGCALNGLMTWHGKVCIK